MIHNLQITNYRVFEHLTVDPLKRVNLIVGANNAGKSSLLEAIHLLASQDKQNSLAMILRERGEFISDRPDSQQSRANPNQVPANHIEGYLVAPLFYGRILGFHAPIKIQSDLPQAMLSLSLGNGEDKKGAAHYLTIASEADATGSQSEKLGLENSLLRSLKWSKRDLLQPGDVQFITTNHLDYSEIANLWDKIVLTPAEESVVEAHWTRDSVDRRN